GRTVRRPRGWSVPLHSLFRRVAIPTSAGRPRRGPRPLDEPLVLEVAVPQPGEAGQVLEHVGPDQDPARVVHEGGLVRGAGVALGERAGVDGAGRQPGRARPPRVALRLARPAGGPGLPPGRRCPSAHQPTKATAIAALNGAQFQGRTLTVNEAKPRAERP